MKLDVHEGRLSKSKQFVIYDCIHLVYTMFNTELLHGWITTFIKVCYIYKSIILTKIYLVYLTIYIINFYETSLENVK